MANRRRIPWWVVVLAFALFVGGAIGLLAYGRARRVKVPARPKLDRGAAMSCLARTPSGEVAPGVFELEAAFEIAADIATRPR